MLLTEPQVLHCCIRHSQKHRHILLPETHNICLEDHIVNTACQSVMALLGTHCNCNFSSRPDNCNSRLKECIHSFQRHHMTRWTGLLATVLQT